MSENEPTTKSERAEERTRETRSFVRTVRRATRHRYAPEEKIRIVLEGFRREMTVNDLCRRLFSALGYVPPAEYEVGCYGSHVPALAGIQQTESP